MKNWYFFTRITAVLLTAIVTLPLFADKPELPDSWKTDDFTEVTVPLEATFRLGDQFNFHEVFPQLPTRFQYRELPPSLEGDIIVELEIVSKGWNEPMQSNEVEIENGYCVQTGSTMLTLHSVDTIMDERGAVYFSKVTTYNITFFVSGTQVLPGLNDNSGPNPDVIRNITMMVYDNVETNIALYYLNHCSIDSHWDSDLQRSVYGEFEKDWLLLSDNPDQISSDTDVVKVNSGYYTSYFGAKEGTSVISVISPLIGGNQQPDTFQFTITVKDAMNELTSGRCGATVDDIGGYLFWSIDNDYTLSFRIDPGAPFSTLDGDQCKMPDFNYPNADECNGTNTGDGGYEEAGYCIPNPSPWNAWSGMIRKLDLTNLRNIGTQAFYDMSNLKSVKIPSSVTSIGSGAFWGCENLTTLEMESPNPPSFAYGVLYVAEDPVSYEPTRNIHIIIVPDSNSLAAYKRLEASMTYPQPLVFVVANAMVEGLSWDIHVSESSQEVAMTISGANEDEPPLVLERKDGEMFPWDTFEDAVKEIVIGDNISYIGRDVFEALTDLTSIQFTQQNHPLDSIHIGALPANAHLWKFALGNPQDGPIVPPAIITGDMPLTEAFMRWAAMFSDSTVLYVPDSTFEYNGQIVRAIDLYRNDPIWGYVFNRITDRTVDTAQVTDNSITLSWIPLENAAAYRLTVYDNNCPECTASIDIPATVARGLVDWSIIDYAPRRAPQGDDGNGGMTLTISIKPGSGNAPNKDVEVQVSNLQASTSYSFTREVITQNGSVNAQLVKSGSFETLVAGQTTGLEDAEEQQIGEVNIYDLLGRPVGTSIESLPEGIYVLDNGKTRTTIMLRR